MVILVACCLLFNKLYLLLSIIIILLYFISQLLAIPRKLYPYFIKSIFQIPILALITIQNLFNLKGANRTFIKTEHNKSNVDDAVIQIFKK